MKKGRRV